MEDFPHKPPGQQLAETLVGAIIGGAVYGAGLWMWNRGEKWWKGQKTEEADAVDSVWDAFYDEMLKIQSQHSAILLRIETHPNSPLRPEWERNLDELEAVLRVLKEYAFANDPTLQ